MKPKKKNPDVLNSFSDSHDCRQNPLFFMKLLNVTYGTFKGSVAKAILGS